MNWRLVEWVDRIGHHLLDPYINAEVFGLHLPGWGFLQVQQNRLCNYYEHLIDGA